MNADRPSAHHPAWRDAILTIRDADVISAEECRGVVEQLFELESSWLPPPNGYPYSYRLGAASSVSNFNLDNYRREARHFNPIMRERFGRLFDRVKDAIAQTMGEPVDYAPDMGLPGFHVYRAPAQDDLTFWHPHFDQMFRYFFWEDPIREERIQTLSFLLLLASPPSTTGLRYWDVLFPDRRAMTQDEMNAHAEHNPGVVHPYRVGTMAVFSGLFLHQPAVPREAGESLRITLQGHAARLDGVWQLYW